ncbi:MAG: IS701 family transposase [Ignavibacteria bacterium]|nr:IS701 family transposase [Ignavibacteria bacterium]
MKPKRADKKNFSNKTQYENLSDNSLNSLINSSYNSLFKVYTKSCTHVAEEYLSGLLQCEKGHENMERMVEKVNDSDYKRYIHFLSVSKWSASDVNLVTMKSVDNTLREQKIKSGLPTGLVIDETSHLKKGLKSVGVARQYAGVVGKVDNCPRTLGAVHVSLGNEKLCSLVGTELFLPEGWTKDKQRCDEAGVPELDQKFQTKPELALKLVKRAIDLGIEFDFIAGDGLYGHNAELTRALDALDQFYVLDVHKDELIFLTEPTFSIPERKGNRGKYPTKIQPDIEPVQLQNYIKLLADKDFSTEQIRKTAKGWKSAKVHTATVWHWDGKEEKACKRTLVITKSEKIKYSLSNGDKQKYTNKEWAYFQCSRYWVERCFDDCKNELGMSGYQVTGWLAWQHHMALVMIASLYILTLKLENQEEMPLLSVRDARLLVIAKAFATQKEVDLCLEHIRIRHRQRQADIDRYYK